MTTGGADETMNDPIFLALAAAVRRDDPEPLSVIDVAMARFTLRCWRDCWAMSAFALPMPSAASRRTRERAASSFLSVPARRC